MAVFAGIRSVSQVQNPYGSPSWRSGPVSGITIIAAILWFQILDLISTRLVIDHGGVELNPVFNQFWGSIWFWPVMTSAKILFLCWLYCALITSDRYDPRASLVTGGIILFQSMFVVGNNLHVLIHLW